MKFRHAIPYILLSAWLLAATAAMAHHGTFVSYDSDHPVTMKATVTEFRYTNPHIQLFFDVKDDKGNVTQWSAEGPDPAVLVAVGWGRKKTTSALSPGAEVTITVAPARNGKPVGTMSNVVLASGDSVCGLGGGAASAANCK
jgi:hypothetical protein